MPLESTVFVENCHNELLGYFIYSTIAQKQNFFIPDDKILYDADFADTSHYGDVLNSLGPIRISFARWVYLSIHKHNNPRTRE